MNGLTIFSSEVFGDVRTELVGGEVYFAGLDIAAALGYKKPRNAVLRHCDKALKRGSLDRIGRKAQINFIPECDVYRLIAKSELGTAKEFERWIFETVLPQIRSTGGYIPINDNDGDDVIMAKAMEIMKRTLSQRDKTIKSQDVTIKKLTEKVVLDSVMVAQAQKQLKIKCSELYKIEYWKDNPEYKVLKNKVLSHFKARKWSSIPAYKYKEVLVFIGNLK